MDSEDQKPPENTAREKRGGFGTPKTVGQRNEYNFIKGILYLLY